VPDWAEVVLCVVDNDAEGSGREVVEAFEAEAVGRMGVRYVVEARRGIPMARNRAVEVALEAGAEAVVFVDDDETADAAVSYTHLRAHETVLDLVCRLLLEKKTK